MTERTNTFTINISKEQHEVLLGIMLGDAHLERADNKKSARLKIEQSKEKEEYVNHLRSLFLDWGASEVREAGGEKKDNYAFSTKFSITLLEYHQRFYPDNNEKRIPKFEKGEFTARSFAYLYMDDGGIKSKESKGVFINTYCFPEENQDSFCVLLEEEFKLKAKTVTDRGYFRIFISGYSYETFIKLTNPFVLPFFSYKIPAPRSKKSRFNKE